MRYVLCWPTNELTKRECVMRALHRVPRRRTFIEIRHVCTKSPFLLYSRTITTEERRPSQLGSTMADTIKEFAELPQTFFKEGTQVSF
jgi:hypothetical protein